MSGNGPSLADDAILVFGAGIVPLFIFYALDFISDKWMTIRETRRNGMIQLFISLPSLGFVIFYIVVQISKSDYKEAAAAIAVGVFNGYFVSRTIWGLILLYEYRNWNVSALRCLVRLGYRAPVYKYHSTLPDSTTDENQTHLFRLFGVLNNCANIYNWAVGNMEIHSSDCDLSLEDIKRTVDYHMVVNSSLIDNEFSISKLPVRLSLFSRFPRRDPERHSAMAQFVASWLKSAKPEECSVRWLVSFLAKFGYRWVTDTRGLGLDNTGSLTHLQRIKRRTCRNLAFIASSHTTQGMVEENGSTEKFVNLRSPDHAYSTGQVPYLDGVISITERCMLPFKMNCKFGKVVELEETTIRSAAQVDWHKKSLTKLSRAERSSVENITAGQLAYFSVLMEIFAAEVERVSFDSDWAVHYKDGDPWINILMCQLGNDVGEDYEQFSQTPQIRKDVSSSFLWDNNPKCLLLQTSIHVDNYLALESGDRLDAYVEDYWTNSHLRKPELRTSVFEQQYDLEMTLLQHEVTRRKSIQCDTPRFIGCAVESVRSILASWVAENDADTFG